MDGAPIHRRICAQVFGKFGWQDARTDLDLSVAYADNRMNGNGLQEKRLLEQDYSSIYTQPDITKNRSLFLNLTGKHSLSDRALLSGVYTTARSPAPPTTATSTKALENSIYQPNADERDALAAAGYSGFPTSGANAANTPFPYWRCLANTLLADEPNEKCSGLINRSRTDQENFGLAGQLSVAGELAGRKNLFIIGAGYDQSNLHFQQSGQYGYINPDRSVTPVDAWADGSQNAGEGEVALDSRVSLNGRTRTVSVFATDTLSLNQHWHATVSGRYNRSTLKNRDNLNPGGAPTRWTATIASTASILRWESPSPHPVAGMLTRVTTKAAALRPPSNWAVQTRRIPASCPMPWLATRR
jgi:hypothetical protein